MTQAQFVLLFLCLNFGDVDCEETLLELIDAVIAGTTQCTRSLTKFSTQLDAITNKMKDSPTTAKERLFAKELKREEQKEIERLHTTASYSLTRLRQLLTQFRSSLEKELSYFLPNGMMLSFKYSTELQQTFLFGLKRAMERTSSLQSNLDRLTRLIRLNFPAQ
ncbi:hypothetical protein D915_006953 [Fasciola hepatica]|uniref:Uncharacterized protein n=1 Tax=Fasciola hepatica TaxID=6192 RepID=A0A4E0R658_FASHE|nr:hypothetical protein D915_006953 [Fasciola hepatica]